jgi:glycosyltransferase involved in cell wall biosynthesis
VAPVKTPRITFLTDILTPYTLAVLAALSERCQLTALFCSYSGTRALGWTFSDIPFRHRVIGGLTVRRRSPDATDFYLSPRILAALARSRPEVIISGGFSFPSLYAAAYARCAGAGLIIQSDGTARSEASIGRGQRITRRILVHASGAATGNSELATERFAELGWTPDRVFLVPHTTNVGPLHEVARSRRYTADERLSVLHVGRLIPRKGVDRLVSAVGLAREHGADVRLVLVGSGSEEAALRAQAERLAVPVESRGFVDQAGLPSQYAAADAFAFPTLDDPFGIVLLEAAASGLPLIASPHGGATRDLVLEGETGFVVEPDDLEAQAHALVTLARDPGLREQMGRSAYRRTLDRTPQAAADKYVEAAQWVRPRGAAPSGSF